MAVSAQPWSEKFRRSVTLLIDKNMGTEEAQARVAQFARQSVQELIDKKRAAPTYHRFVDNVADAPEEKVKLNGGSIVYLFSHLYQAVIFALEYAVQRSPEKSGAYRRGWVVFVDDLPWDRPFEEIPNGSQITLTNREPYHRKIDVGGQITSVPPGIVEDTRQALRQRFPNLQVDRSFVVIRGVADQFGDPVPYVLKRGGIDSGLSFSRQEGWSRRHRPRSTRRIDRQAGQTLTYPAVVFSERVR